MSRPLLSFRRTALEIRGYELWYTSSPEFIISASTHGIDTRQADTYPILVLEPISALGLLAPHFSGSQHPPIPTTRYLFLALPGHSKSSNLTLDCSSLASRVHGAPYSPCLYPETNPSPPGSRHRPSLGVGEKKCRRGWDLAFLLLSSSLM
ncbi:hypothetical protein ACLB2K_047683 [Fragaria x ananassa]